MAPQQMLKVRNRTATRSRNRPQSSAQRATARRRNFTNRSTVASHDPARQKRQTPTPSASLVYNNLCAVGSGLAYIHKRQVVIVPTLPGVASGSGGPGAAAQRVS